MKKNNEPQGFGLTYQFFTPPNPHKIEWETSHIFFSMTEGSRLTQALEKACNYLEYELLIRGGIKAPVLTWNGFPIFKLNGLFRPNAFY